MAETGDETRERDEKRDETERDEEERGQELQEGRSEAEADGDRDEERERDERRGLRDRWPPPKKLWVPLIPILLIALLVVYVLTDDNEASQKAGQPESPIVGAAAVQKRIGGIPQSELALGNPKAPVTLVAFNDLQCPLCKKSFDNSVPLLLDRYVRPGRLRIEYRNWAILGPDSEKAGKALDAVAQQGRAWQFIDLWFLNQGEEGSGYVTDGFIRRMSRAVGGIDAEAVVRASNETGSPESMNAARSEADKLGIKEAPAFLISRRGEQPKQLQLADPTNPNQLTAAIDRELGQQ